MALSDAAALPPHALPWSGIDGLSQPGAERFARGTRGKIKTRQQNKIDHKYIQRPLALSK
jgi:hypothetical protein